MNSRPEYIVVGRFGRPRGVTGDIYIVPATDDPDRFLDLKEIFVIRTGSREKMRLQSVEIISGRPVVRISGIQSREEASQLTNLTIEIPFKEVRPLPDGRYYQFDLIGCRVFGRDRTDYGVIEEVYFYPSSDLYRVVSEKFGETLLPAVDRFIIKVDIEKKEIIIDPLPGLFTPKGDRP